jgi:hypothetical protein
VYEKSPTPFSAGSSAATGLGGSFTGRYAQIDVSASTSFRRRIFVQNALLTVTSFFNASVKTGREKSAVEPSQWPILLT